MIATLETDCIYHVYNRANGSENLFREARNYDYFLRQFLKHVSPVAMTYAWCLMPNHFHMMLQIRPVDSLTSDKQEKVKKYSTYQKFVSKQFSNLFSAYAQAYNKVFHRHGSLFQPNMKRTEVDTEDYFTQLVLYIHNNPVNHGFVDSAWDWPHSSIHFFSEAGRSSGGVEILEPSTINSVISWFGGREAFEEAHGKGSRFPKL